MISVIMPVYQSEKWLEESVGSVLRQTCSDFELLLVEDASPDASGKMCDDFAMKDSRIRVFHMKQHGGVSCARNQGLKECKGEFVLFLDSDDMLEPETLEVVSGKSKECNADIIFFNYVNFYQSGGEENNYADISECMYQGEDVKLAFKKLYEYRIIHNIGTKIYRRSTLKGVWFDEKADIYEDVRFCLAAMQNVRTLFFINRPFYRYRRSSSHSLSSVYNRNYYKNLCVFLRELRDFMGGMPDFEYWFAQNVMGLMRGACINAMKCRKNFHKEFLMICNNQDVKKSKDVFEENAFKDIPFRQRIQYMIIWNHFYLGGLVLWGLKKRHGRR